MEKKQLMAVAIVIVLLCVAGTAYALTRDNGDGRETLIVETSPDFAPFDYTLGEEFVGIDMDIVRAVCDDMGYNVQFRQNTFDSILLSVPQGKADIGASGFTITEDRSKSVLFSDPYFEIHQVVVTHVDSGIETFEDVVNSRISVQNGTTGADYAAQISVDAGSNVIYQASYPSVILDLLNKKADCEIVDEAVGISQAVAHPELRVLDILTESPIEHYGFIFSKDNADLQQRFNESLAKLTESGLVQDIIDHYESNGYSPETPSYFSYSGELVVETSPDFPPFEYMYGMEYAGIDMDIVRAMCDDMNYRLELRDNNFDSIILSVSQGKCDMGASGFTKTAEREEQVLFSDPYYAIKQVVVVKEGSDIQTLDDVRGKTISVQTGTSGADYAESLSGDIIYQKAYTEVVLDVLTGKADCEIVDNTVAQGQVARNPGLKILDITDAETEYYGFIFSKDNQELCDKVNECLAKLTENGTIGAITSYYAEHEYAEIPSYFSTQEIVEDTDDGDKGFWGDLWDRFYNDFLKFDRYHYIFEGLKNTLIITAAALVIGLIFGAMMAIVRGIHDQTGKLKILNAIFRVYITVIRGTPMMVQLLLIYYVVFASSDDSLLIASVAFGLNSAAYVAETFRSGINAVPKGQMEACRSLGMSNWTSMRKVILPQALRNVTPALGNEGISLLKETSIAGYIGIMDLTRGADIIRGQTYDALFPIIVAALIYLAIVLILQYLIKRMERRLNSAY